MKKMIYLIAIAIVVFVGWKLTSRTSYESAAYTVSESDGSFELRDYPDLMLATTSMTKMSGNDGSFGRLFRYISGGNDDQEKVAMTTPVFMEAQQDQTAGQMGFVIPKKVMETSIPEPSSDKVQLTRRDGGRFAVIRFNGRINLETESRQLARLMEWIETRGLEASGSNHEIAGYDPPWTPGPLRRNEILVRLKS